MGALGRPEHTSIQHGLFLAPQAITHPGWNPNTMNNDLTLLKLATPARYTPQISPVCLAAANDVLPAGLTCVTTGWGRTSGVGTNLGRAFRQSGLVLTSHSLYHFWPTGNVTPARLQQVAVPLVTVNQCRQFWGSKITDAMICAGGAGASSCQVSNSPALGPNLLPPPSHTPTDVSPFL